MRPPIRSAPSVLCGGAGRAGNAPDELPGRNGEPDIPWKGDGKVHDNQEPQEKNARTGNTLGFLSIQAYQSVCSDRSTVVLGMRP